MDNSGYSRMPRIVEVATNDIKHHLWSLYHLARSINARTIVELGVRSGDSTRALLAAAQDNGGRLFSYDIDGDAYRVREVTEKFGISWIGEWSCVQSDSSEASKYWGEWSVDLVFLDTDHSLETTRREIAAWYSKVRPGGLMLFHDTGLDEPGRDGVTPAIMEFLETHPKWSFENHPHCAEGDTGFGILRKP